MKRKRATLYIALSSIFVLFYSCLKHLGNYWDWGLPYFHNFSSFAITNELRSWTEFGVGRALVYQSWYYLKPVSLLLIRFVRLQPETCSAVFIALLLSAVFLILVKMFKYDGRTKYLIAAVAVLGSPTYYKLLAGHINYLISLVIFMSLIYFVFYKFKKTFLGYFILALVLAFIGVQIQFFIFAAIFILIYFLFDRKKLSWEYAWLLIVIPLLVNLPWLSNYLVGANSIASTSQGATQMLFADSAFASPVRIFFMIFSPATNIQYAYDRWMLIYFGIFAAIVYGSIVYYLWKMRSTKDNTKIQKYKNIDVLVVNLIVFTLLGTGYFQKIPIPLIKTFYPMFRESGHFAPIIILFEVLTLGSILPEILERIQQTEYRIQRLFPVFLILYSVGFVAINAYTFYKYLPRIDYNQARAEFQPFENFGQSDNSTYRVLSYPFWNQYGFNNVPNVEHNGKLLNNSGWDSFIEFSGKDHISNYQPGGVSINDTLQYRLLTTNDLTELEQKNVKYLYDFSGIYTSNWDLYTPTWTYDDNLSLIKNDPSFIPKLIAKNPGEITKVADNIYKINDSLPRIYLSQNTEYRIQNTVEPQLYFKKINPTKHEVTIKNLSGVVDLNFLESYHKDWQIYLNPTGMDLSKCADRQKENNGTTECLASQKFWASVRGQSLADSANSSHSEIFGYANNWKLDANNIKKFASNQIKINSDGSVDMNLSIYFSPQTAFNYSLAISVCVIFATISYLVYIQVVTYGKKNDKK